MSYERTNERFISGTQPPHMKEKLVDFRFLTRFKKYIVWIDLSEYAEHFSLF